ncbi:MAG TPA: HIT family protein [Burkholderiaceae bacterium]|nr:HIT family protein [Burkholderiaceae bacterium]HRP29500.1 HIT family protein [Burkholderiaceae bacterium]
MTMPTACPFCALPAARIVHANALAVVVRDAFPVSPGHTLVLPRRHVQSFFDLEPAEHRALFDLLGLARRTLEQDVQPAGYNIGINDGTAAGQTVAHLHVHLIPRFPGDRSDPRGGVRWVLPQRADYWSIGDGESR